MRNPARSTVRTLWPLAPLWLSPLAAQQVSDPDFNASVANPAYSREGPTVAIDEAHGNFHTADGRYKPFAEVLRSDGYEVRAFTSTFDARSLGGIDVLVISNARNLPAVQKGDTSQPAFTNAEIDAVRAWVEGGGALLLIADHAPFGQAAESLAQRFGIAMGKGYAFDRVNDELTTTLAFSRDNHLLGDHPITRGRGASEAVSTLTTFTGQSLSVPPGAAPLMKLSDTAREAATPDDLNAEAAAAKSSGSTQLGSRSASLAGRAQGLAMTVGNGKIVVLGEAAMLSAQIASFPDGSVVKAGMNVPGNDNRQFALNALHWLSGLID
ncbi:MAG TPA: DUF4350 domain-containing protein [Gammaproteobacteria bacterium]